jgi:hypothetical protein
MSFCKDPQNRRITTWESTPPRGTFFHHVANRSKHWGYSTGSPHAGSLTNSFHASSFWRALGERKSSDEGKLRGLPSNC